MNISEASWPILIKFYVNHHWVGGLIVLGFGADCIKIVVFVATDLQLEKHKKNSSPKPQGPELLYFVTYVAMFGSLLCKSCQL